MPAQLTYSLLPIMALSISLVCYSTADNTWTLPTNTPYKELRVEKHNNNQLTSTTTTIFLDNRYPSFTLLDSQGKPRPFLLLSCHGTRYTILFNATSEERLYLIPSTQPATTTHPALPHTSGLLHTTRSYDGSAVDTQQHFEKLWAQATPQDTGFASRIYSAFNPFGPNPNTLHRYDGFIQITKPGNYTFCTASTDASFLMINNKLIASWPGHHPVHEGLSGDKKGSLHLPADTHRLTYLHANGDHHESFAIAAMIPPNEKRHIVIPSSLFTPLAYARVGPLTLAPSNPMPEFIWENNHMVAIHGHYLFELHFETPSYPTLPETAFSWDFGDTTRPLQGRRTTHLYFGTNTWNATLTITHPDGTQTQTTQQLTTSPRYGQNENNDTRTLELLANATTQEQQRGIHPAGYALISRGYFFYLQEEKAAEFAPHALAQLDNIPPADIAPLFSELALGVQSINEQYELAERCFQAIISHAPHPHDRAVAALHYAGMLTLCLNRPQEAQDIMNTIKRSDLTTWEPRLYDIYQADLDLVLNSHATAHKHYLAIPKTTAVLTEDKLNREALFGYNTRHFRLQNLLTQKLYPESLTELNNLEWEVPEERMEPRTNLLKAQALLGNDQPRKALVCLQRALIADSDGVYAPAIRLELARIYSTLNQLAHARHQLETLRKAHPWASEEITAREMLHEINLKAREIQP